MAPASRQRVLIARNLDAIRRAASHGRHAAFSDKAKA
jgi:hypothetical protein